MAIEFCEQCGKFVPIYSIKNRQAEILGCPHKTQIYWGATTIMRKTTTSFDKWQKVFWLYTDNPKIPIQRIEKEVGVNWRTARRLRNLIRNNKQQAEILFAWERK